VRDLQLHAVSGPKARGSFLAVLTVLMLPLRGDAQEPARVAPAAAPEATADSFELVLQRLDKLEFDLGRTLNSTRLDLASAQRRFEAAEERLDAAAEPTPVLREEVGARRLQLSSKQRAEALLEERLERTRADKRSWRRLDELRTRRVPAENIAEWSADSAGRLEQLGRESVVKQQRREELRQELEFTRERRAEMPAGSESERWAATQAQALGELLQYYEEDVESLEASRRIEEQVAAAVKRESQEMPLSARLGAVLHQLRLAWNYHLTGAEREPITPGKIVSAIAIFLIGYALARVASQLLGSRVFPRLRLEPGAAQAFQSLAFYFLLLVAFLTALRMVQIPLTAFAVIGGALAIGVGFGSQTVVNNFISGLILLAERPIKLGDLIEVEGVHGSVERIGLRSTRVRTGDNVHIIVPNAAFLEGKVVNWTHTDPKVRVTITVGVVYGSPTREVERLIFQALDEHPKILKRPEPVVLFRDFGDNALIFETRFWIEMRSILDRLRVESDIRFHIDELYREAGIVIAFPQRDVHLDSVSPVEVRIVDGTEKQDAHET
jgi:small-conductance mechanosensitive channel